VAPQSPDEQLVELFRTQLEEQDEQQANQLDELVEMNTKLLERLIAVASKSPPGSSPAPTAAPASPSATTPDELTPASAPPALDATTPTAVPLPATEEDKGQVSSVTELVKKNIALLEKLRGAAAAPAEDTPSAPNQQLTDPEHDASTLDEVIKTNSDLLERLKAAFDALHTQGNKTANTPAGAPTPDSTPETSSEIPAPTPAPMLQMLVEMLKNQTREQGKKEASRLETFVTATSELLERLRNATTQTKVGC
jgi:hypothetical protein